MPTISEILQSGWKLHQGGQVDDAECIYRQVLDQTPRQPEAWVYLGIALFDKRCYQESADAYRKALEIRESPIAWNNLGNSLRMLGEIEEAESCFATALQQDPKYLSAFKNRGTLWVWTGAIERGLYWYQKGLEIDPGNPELHRNLGVIHLLLGNNDVGWPEYRWRWKMPGARPDVAAPLWQGESLRGKTILLYPEQGRGDSIQFVRIAKVLHDVGAHVVLQCGSELIPLFTSAAGVSLLIPSGAAVPQVDYQASLIDVVDVWYSQHGQLPYGIGNIESGYLRVSDALIEYWQQWIHSQPDWSGKKVGINWQGNPEHHADLYRSIPLAALKPLSEIPGVQIINLQFGFGVEQLENCDFADHVKRLPNDVDVTGGAFTDTAAILKNLDLVVTSDTAIAHLAEALGVRVILMLSKVPDWRWLIEGESTPWYPSMEIVRQETMNDWVSVAAKVAKRFA